MRSWDIETLPDILKTKVQNTIWHEITVGESGAFTYLLSNEKEKNRYLKIVSHKLNNSMEKEARLLKWLDVKM